ncbi:MAG TPA: hydroxymethylbilane synthase [Solirubrobacteraceae bacterium]|nr:hydroxymethylbilane synthase [Solirubrobacteraceae bacterium]
MSAPLAPALRIGTRRSALALAQAQLVAGLMRADARCEIVPMDTRGDREGDGEGAGDGAGAQDKSRWVQELEHALSAGEIDLAVHSAKDVPGELAAGLALLAAPARASAEDVLCGARSLEALPAGARVGTSSLRRIAQLRAAREDLEVVELRGNVDTRLRKLADPGERLDAIVLARAGLQRLGREREALLTLDPERFVPAPGQGTIALEGRAADARARAAVRALADAHAGACLRAERALARELGASCHTPLGAHACAAGRERLRLRAWVGLPDGSQWTSDEQTGELDAPEQLGRRVAERLLAVGAGELLARAQEMAP